MALEKKHKEPLFHVVKRMSMSGGTKAGIRIGSVLIGLIVGAIFVAAFSTKSHNFFQFFGSLFNGVFATERKLWTFLRDGAILLGVSIALIPAFKMKFWNLGGNGQILMGCLATCAFMYYLGGKFNDVGLVFFEIIGAVVAGAIWAVIPAIFKAFFKTNESLFTLMLNYVALNLVAVTISSWYPGGTGSMNPISYGRLPSIGTSQFGKNIIYVVVFLLITAAIYWYLNYSKHGYELSVVGESENTARYIGINVKAVTIRTLILSGALCGLVGFFLSAGINGMMSSTMDGNMGFTGIMVAWLSHFEPILMTVVAFFITFITKGMKTVNEAFGFTDEALSSVIIGIIYFLLIASEFFVSYKILWRQDAQKVVDKITYPFKWFFDKVEWLFKKIGSGFVWLFKKIASLFKKKAKEEK